ncbi:MAG: polysaccharide deacetylase family protein [Candidatus Nomurabacteria bacterium]
MKKRKLFILIFIFVIVVGITYAFTYRKTESPKIPEKIQEIPQILPTGSTEVKPKINTEVKSVKEITPDTKKLETSNSPKYKIIDRSVIVPEGKTDNKKVVLLTVDDGPSSQALAMVEVFKKHNAKAIFFINGVHDGAHKGVIEKIKEEGFAIGNHTWNHLDLKKEKNTKTIDKEIDTNTNLINKITGENPKFFRPPYGDTSPYVIKYVKEHGMIEMNWSNAAKDWEKSAREKDVFVSNAVKDIQSGAIILMHEHPWSLANLDALLTDLKLKGYSFVDPKDIVE